MKRLLSVALFACAAVIASPQQYPQMGPDIYNTTADAKPTIAQALELARKQNKHVLLDFGANWCVWCHRLHELFTTDPQVRAALQRDYITVMVDVNKRNGPARNADLDEYYGNPTQHGLPVLVVLDASGRRLHTQETGALEEGRAHSPEKVLAFLAKWAPER
ncbi:thioredoxin family protein [Actomonas aquatica]|uniref:Thioredoxin family protein n=1 Tax=Actomonas aquatica TaxID=2866162 RepID=A0ABZ1CDG7_9BACT|nr:thioredoxin family protein [Opitutus sp. WL0086]WRQ89461.1 thioredoxin family protein [Opitutus sp. WL0086]